MEKQIKDISNNNNGLNEAEIYLLELLAEFDEEDSDQEAQND